MFVYTFRHRASLFIHDLITSEKAVFLKSPAHPQLFIAAHMKTELTALTINSNNLLCEKRFVELL